MTQPLHSLLRSIGLQIPQGLGNPLVEGITCDSRSVKKGTLFLGLPGEKFDGGSFWPQALSLGAVAAVIGPEAAELKTPGPKDAVVVVPEPVGKWVGELAAAFWERPTSKIPLIGVTGTNGKTTTTHLIDYLSTSVGLQSALFGTLVNRWPNHQEVAKYTTGVAVAVQENLSKAVQAGAQIAAMEVSSHALVQNRVAGCYFAGAVFTNLTQDHLDYHLSMDEYFRAKTLLFKPPFLDIDSSRAVVNIDNCWGEQLSRALKNNCWKCSLDESKRENAELFIGDVEMNSSGIRAHLFSPLGDGYFTSPLIGNFNLMNLLQAVGALIQQGLPLQELLDSIVDFPGVPGRMERINLTTVGSDLSSPTVLVDYAHTPDGLMNALIESRVCTKGKLICVFGCGGDRDKGKRSKMGAIAARFADHVVITSDNPRTESPQNIINDILSGMPSSIKYTVDVDRSKAIKIAILSANPEDLILIAGKGHEDYQVIGNKKFYFNDREFARQILKDQIKA